MKLSLPLIPATVLALLFAAPVHAWDHGSGFSYYRDGSRSSHGIAFDQSRHWSSTSLFYSDRRGSYSVRISEPRHRSRVVSRTVVHHGPVVHHAPVVWHPAPVVRYHHAPPRIVHSHWHSPGYSVVPIHSYHRPVIVHHHHVPRRVVHREVHVVHHHHRPRHHYRSSRHHGGPVGVQPGWRY